MFELLMEFVLAKAQYRLLQLSGLQNQQSDGTWHSSVGKKYCLQLVSQ
jgi:hypothetical protein